LLRLEDFVDQGAVDAELINSLFRGLHTIKGSAGMLEFKDVQGVAHKLENICDLLRKDRMPLSESCVNLLFEGRDILTALVHAAIDGGAVPEGVQRFIDHLDSFASVYESTAKLIESSEPPPPEELDGLAFEAEVARLVAAKSAADAAAATAKPARKPRARRAAQVAPALGAVDAAAAQAAVDALLAPEPAKPAPGPQPAARKPVEPAKPEQPAATASEAPKAAPAMRSGGKNQTIRVDIERLDMLLNLVGELVINRTRISDIASTLARNVNDPKHHQDVVVPLAKDLADSSALLARTTNEIQESIMKVRMVPIGQVFDRFPRMVRDLAKARNKEIKLEINGAETDLDKTIVDEVGEPLMHLVRNCVDHGIEEPDARERRGKPRTGTVKLNAFHEGNQVIIEIRDDGGGINLEKVRERGIKQGLITEADRPTDREIIELIFTPGFSTAEQVTDVSGRGVGMDVVKKTILRLKGVFDVDSVLGEGTRFSMKLPLTLAIIQALLVRVANELYSIPLDSVIESQRIDAADVRSVHGNEVITLRGGVVPLIRVGEFFNLTSERDPDKVMIVIVGLQGRQVGLVVDSFQGEQEIVIKPLSDVIGRIAGISGATILGNGLISLIIDVHSLVASAYAGGRATRAEFSGV
jgi:two-component system chemotaxis sensor kinase CheA